MNNIEATQGKQIGVVMRIVRSVHSYLFKPRYLFNRVQFNMVALFFVTVGVISGSYLVLLNVFPNIFALNDTKKEWSFTTDNISQYTYNSNLVTCLLYTSDAADE